MLEIRTKSSPRNGVRVDIFRRYRLTDEVSERIKYNYKQIGSFYLKDGYDSSMLEYLNPEEVLQLKNWLAEAKFAERLQSEVDDAEKITLRIPKKLHAALTKLYIEAKRADIDFIPSEIMLEALLKRTAIVESIVDKVNGFKSNILNEVGIHVELEKPKEFDQSDRKLFKALLDLDQPLGKTCSELEEAALKLGKNRKVPPPQIKEWAGLIPGRNLERPVKKWAYSIAIDVLLKNGVNPCAILPPEKIAHYWAMQKTHAITLNEAVNQFELLFKVAAEDKAGVKVMIESIYKNPAGELKSEDVE